MTVLLEKLFKWLFFLCLIIMALAFLRKDQFPDVQHYDVSQLRDPVQRVTSKKSFLTEINGYTYEIIPKYDYELSGVVVSAHDADSITDSVHDRIWKDYLNLRDICVVWDRNISSGVYLDLDYKNDSWTCWVYWPDRETGSRFSGEQLSNNHLLSNDPSVNEAIMGAEVGDHIRVKGMLAEYKNRNNGFHRGTSTVRTDKGNGACETIYVTEFETVNKANAMWRGIYSAAKLIGIICMVCFLVMFFIAPPSGTRR